ncbi:DUF4377 domain-containing protein [Chryseobacterium sp. JUb7]|uniref:DUF4377 domain-containing protein n=1 Tax=Chryseobacterium sp. JUb7 TaxID=2940599 RepID=UPI00216890B2|nr:DUF4377 domain-containing protein [Chryseobacterium sp. JUb7]MCS3533147.1 hypothetical protein [Chryseobacterium sp. JUb7]
MKNKTLILTGMLALSTIFVSAQNSPPPTIKVVKGSSAQHNDAMVLKQTMIIGPKPGNCIGISQRGVCYMVKKDKKQKEWETFDQPIKGFKYVPGFEYIIEVKIQRAKEPIEGVNEEYVLVKQISKKKVK